MKLFSATKIFFCSFLLLFYFQYSPKKSIWIQWEKKNKQKKWKWKWGWEWDGDRARVYDDIDIQLMRIFFIILFWMWTGNTKKISEAHSKESVLGMVSHFYNFFFFFPSSCYAIFSRNIHKTIFKVTFCYLSFLKSLKCT